MAEFMVIKEEEEIPRYIFSEGKKHVNLANNVWLSAYIRSQ